MFTGSGPPVRVRVFDSSSKAFWIFSKISRPSGFLSGWYLRASLRYSFFSVFSSGRSWSGPKPRMAYASSSLTPGACFVFSILQRSSTARSSSTGFLMGQLLKRFSSHSAAM